MNHTNQSKQEFMYWLFDEIHKIPIDLVIGHYMDLYPRGMHMMGLCPFHPDTSLGSFVVTPSKGLWHCFTDGIGGDAIKFVMLYHDRDMADELISHSQPNKEKYHKTMASAALEIGVVTGILSKEAYAMYSRKRYDGNIMKSLANRLEEKKEKPASKKAPAHVIWQVYDLMPGVCGLSRQDEKHLTHERGLSKDHLGDYFSFPTGRTNLVRLISLALIDNASKDRFGKLYKELTKEEKDVIRHQMEEVDREFKNVPGFFYDEQKKKFCFSSYRGIGFVVRDEQKRPVGIQIRKNQVKDGESRYVWFSSAFAADRDTLSGGSSPGAPGGVIYPDHPGKHPCVCITEGRFKAEMIAKKGNIAIYVSGVSSWKSVMHYVKTLSRNEKNIFVMFDADMMGNCAVHGSLTALCHELENMGKHPVLVLWKKQDGKGFDDIVLNAGDGYAKKLSYIPFRKFEAIYQYVLAYVLKAEGVSSIRDIPTPKRDAFNKKMQMTMEDVCTKKKDQAIA